MTLQLTQAVSHCRVTAQKCLVNLSAPQHGQCSSVQLRNPLGPVGTSHRLLSLLEMRERLMMM